VGQIWVQFNRRGTDLKKEAGRPAIDDAYRLRAMAWFNAVSLASGMNDSELEVFFGDASNRTRYKPGERPGLWRKYKTGKICPKFKPDVHGRPSIVERVEARFPGTAQWMGMPFWDVLSYKVMSMPELRKIYLSLQPNVRDLILMEPVMNGRMFWRRPTDPEQLYDSLLSIGNLDATTAVLALIKEAEITQNQTQHQLGLACWINCINRLQHPTLIPLMQRINNIIEDRFTRISYVTSDGRNYVAVAQSHSASSP